MYGPEAFDDDPMWDESVDGPDVDASDELRHALPAYANKAISDIDAARIPADASGQIAAVQIALRPPYCDEIFGDDLLPWIPLLVLMFKQLSEPKMKSLGTLILDNAVRLIQLFMQRNTHAFRHVFADILQCVADLLEYTESDARTATEQAGLSARVLLLPNTLQHLTCASHRCEAMPCCSDELPTCNDHSGEPCFSVDISNDDRIDMLRSSFTLVLGQFMFDSMLVLDFIPAFADILKRQIRCAAPSVQEASSIALLDLVKSMVPPPESARVSLLSLFDIVSTDSFRTPTLELQVVQLVDWLLLPLPADQLKPYARALASLCPRVLEFAHCSELRFKVGDLMFHLHKLFPFMLLYLPSFRVCFDRAAALLPPMRSCFMHIVQTLPECFHSSSLTACDNVAVSDCVSSLSPSDVFHRTSWTFFQDALRRVSEQSPCASLDGISFVCDVFSWFAMVPSDASTLSGVQSALVPVVVGWLYAVSDQVEDKRWDTKAVTSMRLCALDFLRRISQWPHTAKCFGHAYLRLLTACMVDRELLPDMLLAWGPLPVVDLNAERMLLVRLLESPNPTSVNHLPRVTAKFPEEVRTWTMSRLAEILTETGDNDMEIAIAGTCGRLCCIAADITGTNNTGMCPTCDASNESDKVAPSNRQSRQTAWRSVSSFVTLLEERRSAAVRAAMATSLFRFLRHCTTESLRQSSSELRSLVLSLLVDDHADVRSSVASSITLLVEDDVDLDHCGLVTLFVPDSLQSVSRSNRIAKAVNELVYGLAEANSNPNNLESYKDALTALAKMAIRLSGTARSIIVFLLIQSMLDEDVSLRALAYQQICFVAQSSGMSTSELIRQPYVEETILKWLPQRRLVCDEVCEALLDVGVETFLEDALPLVLPKLVLDQAIEVLNEISTRLHVQLSTLVVERIAPILHHVLANPDIEPSRATKAIEFLCQRIVPGYRFSDLLKLSKQGLVVSLIDSMGIPAQRNSAEHALQILVLADSGVGFGEYKTSEQFAIPDASTMSAFCADFFLMICDNLNNVIQNSNTGSVDRKVQAVRSLKCLTQLVGPRLSNFASKMVATMKVGLERVGDPAVITEILLLFESFLDALAADHLGTCLSQIVVTLLSCWRSHASSALIRDRIVEILDRLLVGRKSELSKYFAELLPMIPEDPELATIRHSVSGLTRDVDVTRRLSSMLLSVDNESSNVREMALTQLRDALSQPSTAQTLINCVRNGDSLLFVLVTALLRRCSDPSSSVRLLCAECIGALGAVDPSLVGTIHNMKPAQEIGSVESFALILCVDYLAKAVRSSAPKAQNRAMFAVQEILKFAHCRPETPELFAEACTGGNINDWISRVDFADRKGVEFWASLPDAVRELLSPCLTSGYHIADRAAPASTTFHRVGMAHERWLSVWCRYLISRSSGPLSDVFRACRGVVVSDVNTATFLLPHLVLDALGAGELNQIRDEILGIVNHDSGIQERRSSVQAVFELLDILRQLLIKSTGVGLSRFGYYSDQPTGQLSSLLNGIPDRVLAFAAHACGAHTRALRHLEMHVRSSDTAATLEDLDFLQRVFADLDDADGMQGLSFLRTRPPSPVEQARDLESLGQWNDALICHQEQARSDPDHHDTRVALLHCLLRLGRYENCISEVAEIIGDDNHVMDNPVMSKLLSFGIESAWRSANWAALERFMIAHPDPSCFEVGLANVISAWRSDDEERVTATLQQARFNIMSHLAAAAQESYARAYPFWAQLQLLNDFDLARTRVTASVSWPWQQRIASMQPAFTTREPILSVHRLVFEAACRDDLAGQCWLQLARESRLSSEFDQASYAVLRANRLQVRNACLEQAELLRARGNFSQALIVLEEHIASRGQLPIGYTSQERQEELSNMQCLVGELMQLSASRTSDSILSTYRTAIAHCSTLDKPHFLWGSFMDTLLRSELDVQIDDSDRRDVIKKLVPDIIHHYLLSVMSSSGYVFDTLPRVVTLWCEHAEVFVPNGTSKSKGGPSSNRVNDVAAWISDWIKKVPAHNWYVVLPQLVSRLQNENASVQEFLTAVIVRTFLAHPRQSTWIVASIEHYKSDEHRNPVMRILKSVGSKMNGAAREELQRAQRLLSLLVELCTFQIAKEIRSTRLPSNVRRFLKASKEALMMPLQSAMTVAIPERPPDAPGVSSSDVVNPFPLETVMITGIDDHLNILPSKEKPRQARFLGSDGSYHLFLCKVEGEGDMRKNSRMMEVANVVNRLFRASPDSRRRRLRLRTYAVMPLREDCGIIEWVLNTSAFRAIVDFYQSDLPMSAKQAATYYEAHASEPVARYHHLRKVMQPRLHRFFMDTFPEPTTWYENRMLFTRSWAVWAMVGHIVGLGDRHGENILLDRSNGEVIHVDFDCLFDRGLNLRTPEVVPFRLTANALDGMGITQHEGVFRTSCNVAMRVLRDNSGVLQKCLETFVHDPLVEWKSKRVLHQGLGEKAMKNVENRLAGKIANSTLPVSVEGYVDHLIRAAMSPDNLGRMFVGWMPWS